MAATPVPDATPQGRAGAEWLTAHIMPVRGRQRGARTAVGVPRLLPAGSRSHALIVGRRTGRTNPHNQSRHAVNGWTVWHESTVTRNLSTGGTSGTARNVQSDTRAVPHSCLIPWRGPLLPKTVCGGPAQGSSPIVGVRFPERHRRRPSERGLRRRHDLVPVLKHPSHVFPSRTVSDDEVLRHDDERVARVLPPCHAPDNTGRHV